jgi:probable HAF family extracellular repeat protein
MKARVLTQIAGTALFAVVAIPAQLIAQNQSEAQNEKPQHFSHYMVKDLGTLGGTYSYAYGLNNAGRVAGGAATRTQTGGLSQTAFLWHRGQIIDLGTLGGFNTGLNSAAGGPNSRGESALVSETFIKDPNGEDFCGFGTHRQCLGAIWKDGVMTPLSTLGGNNSAALWLNNRGQVVGVAETSRKEAKCATPGQRLRFEAVIWQPNGEIRELRPLPGDTVGFGFGINDNGEAVGTSGLCSNTSIPPFVSGAHAVLWDRDRSPHLIPGLGHTSNIAGSINNRGEVSGTSQLSDGTVHTFLWTRETGTHDIGTLPGSVVTVAPCCHTLNDSGEITGFAIDGKGNTRAFLWKHKVMVDLNTLIPKSSPLYLLVSESINARGQIAGYGVQKDAPHDVHAFLATPCGRDDGDRDGDDLKWCRDDDDTQDASAAPGESAQRPIVVLSEDARKQLQQRLGLPHQGGSQ